MKKQPNAWSSSFERMLFLPGKYIIYSAQFWGESLWPAVVLKVWDTLNIHSSVACDHAGSSK